MIRILTKLLAAALALVLLLAGVIAVGLPRLINSDEFRATLHASAAEVLGTPVEWQSVDAGLFPPRLVIESPVLVAAEARRDAARLTARSIDLRLSLGPLLARRLEIGSLVFRGVELVVTRTADGFELPIVVASEESPDDAETLAPDRASSDAEGSGAEQDELALDLRRIVVSDSRIIVHDRTLPRPIEWQLEDVELEAQGDGVDAPLDVELDTRLAADGRDVGRLHSEGTVSLAGIFDLELQIERLLLAELQPYVQDATLAGVMSGRLSLSGSPSVVSEIDVDLEVEEMAVRTYGLDLQGGLVLQARQALDDPIRFDAKLDLGAGGKADLKGEIGLDGAIRTNIALDGLELAPFAQLAGPELEISGRASGDVELATHETGEIAKLETDLKIASARYADGVLDVGGVIDLGLGLEGLAESDPIRFDVAMDLDSGGHLDAEGVATLAGAVDAAMVFNAVDLAPIAPLLQQGTVISGVLTGNLDIKAKADRTIERLDTKLRIASARVVSDPVDVSGAFALNAGLEGDGPIRLDAEVSLSDGGRLNVEGTSSLDGVLDVNAKIEAFDLAIAKPFLPDDRILIGGRATGTARLVGPVSAPEFVSLDVGFESGLLRGPDYGLEGPFLLTVKLREPLTRARGRVDLDLSAARLSYSDQLDKQPGVRAELTTRFVPEESGEIVFEGTLALRDLDELLVQGTIAETTTVALTSSNFNLKGWSDLFPVLAPYEPEGMVNLDGISVELVDATPKRFGGRVVLRGIGVSVPDTGRVRLRGAIVGEGSRIRTKGLKALIGGLTLAIKGQVDDPLGEAEFELEVRSQGQAEVNDVLVALDSVRDTVYGDLQLAGDIKGKGASEASLYESLEGDIRITIGEKGGGRLRGVSLLRTILDQIPLLGGAARLTQPFRGGRSVDDYFTERFEVIEGDFALGGGKVNARTLRLAYEGYEAKLSGPIRLSDLTIDMTGELLLKSDLVSAIGGLAGGDMSQREPIRIPLARVTNTLSAPEVEMTGETLAAVPKLLFQATGLDTLTIGVGKAIGRALGGSRERR